MSAFSRDRTLTFLSAIDKSKFGDFALYKIWWGLAKILFGSKPNPSKCLLFCEKSKYLKAPDDFDEVVFCFVNVYNLSFSNDPDKLVTKLKKLLLQ